MSEIRGLTLRHPWAFCVARLGKDVENRTWHPSRHGGRIGMLLAIHGGRAPTGGAMQEVADDIASVCRIQGAWGRLLTGEQRRWLREQATDGKLKNKDFVTPGIVAIARLVDVRRDSPSPWSASGQWHWCLEVTPLPESVPHRGALGFWALEPTALERVRELCPAALEAPDAD